MPLRLVHKADFERLLSVRAKTRSAHFAVHHVHGSPNVPKRPGDGIVQEKLSTSQAPKSVASVDNYAGSEFPLRAGCWLGCVVPKRHAKRAVTRNLIKRQIRSAFGRHAATLPAGLWLVRLHQSFPVQQFVSAKSIVLARAARTELDALLVRTA